MGKHAALGLICGSLTLLFVACQGISGAEAKRPQDSGASRAGKVSRNQTPEKEFLKRIADAAQRNDAKELASMLHPDVIASFGEEQCVAAFQQDKAPGMVIAGAPVRSTMASWRNAQGRTQIYREGATYIGGVSMMEGPKVKGVTTLNFAADESGKFYLFVNCNEKAFKMQK